MRRVSESNRRRFERHGSYAVVRLRDPHGETIWRFVDDISLGGLQVYMERPLALGDQVEMELRTEGSGTVFPFSAKVTWCDPGVLGRAGLSFVTLGPGMREWLERYLAG